MAIRDIVQAAAGVGGGSEYVEDVFSTYLYTGTGSAQTINNGIDLDGEGGLVWLKSRSGTFGHRLTDTARGATKELVSNAVTIEATVANALTAFNSTGFALGSDIYYNNNTSTYASWTFRKAPKFFDVVTYTGNSIPGRAIPHNLGSSPGCVIIKAIDQLQNWVVWHRGGSQDNTHGAYLNTSDKYSNKAIALWGSSPGTPDMNATTFSVGGTTINNGSGYLYVAYIFAHDAGGFGDDGEQNVISCGSYTGDGSNGQSVSLGYEPQWLLIKRTDTANSWFLQDSMRPFSVTATEWLQPNTNNAESSGGVAYVSPTSTGFTFTSGGSAAYNANGGTYIYIAIRRPMKTPEAGTEVFHPVTYTGSAGNQAITSVGFPPDLFMANWGASVKGNFEDRLRGTAPYLQSTSTGAEVSQATAIVSYDMSGITLGVNNLNNKSGASFVGYFYKRAPGFMDQVCYTGTGVAKTEAHNLGVVPELMIVKNRSSSLNWRTYNFFNGSSESMNLNDDGGSSNIGNVFWNSTTPTSSIISIGTDNSVNQSGSSFVAYLFSSLAGVSKVGSYSGTGADLNVDCGFSAGARFILIKRTSSNGDWYVWDSARGIAAGNDPYLLLNSTAAEVTSTDYIDPLASGFTVTSSAPAALNASGGTFIFFAVA